MKTNNQIKEIEKGCGKNYYSDSYVPGNRVCECGGTAIEGKRSLCPICKTKLKLLKQFQKEIKGIQGELKKERPMGMSLNEFNDKIFKNKFGDLG